MWALASNGTAEAKRLLERALDSKEPSVRMRRDLALGAEPRRPVDRHAAAAVARQRPAVRAMALSSLGQIGSERAQQAILDATRTASPRSASPRSAASHSMDDARASQQLARLMRDADPTVAQTAINSSYNGGPEVDQRSRRSSTTGSAPAPRQPRRQLRHRGTDLDDAPSSRHQARRPRRYGGYGYGGYYPPGEDID